MSMKKEARAVTKEYPLSNQEHALRSLEAENQHLLREIALLKSELRGKDRLIKKLEKEVYRIGSWE